MKKGRLVTQSMTDKRFFDARHFERIEYPLERAVEDFLRHAGGVSDSVRRELLIVLQEAQQQGRVPLPLFS